LEFLYLLPRDVGGDMDRHLLTASLIAGLLISSCSERPESQVKEEIPAQFASDLRSFLLEGEKLAAMTEQGTSNVDFRLQLANVKATYSLLGELWPESLADEKIQFESAILGWDLALQVWDFHIEESDAGISLIPEGSRLLKDVAAYLGITDERLFRIRSSDEFIPSLLAEASDSFRVAKAAASAGLE
jgi:hypothetical protein